MKIKDILEDNVDEKYMLSDKMWQTLLKHAARHKAKGNGFGFNMVDNDSVASRTLSARYYKDGSEILVKQDGKNPRKLTPRECARLMGFPDSFKIPKTIEEVLEKDVDQKYFYDEKCKFYDELKQKCVSENTFYQWRRVYVRENKSCVCPTLTANMGTGGHNVPIVKTKQGIRKITPRECMRLMGFPENFVQPLSDTQAYKQFGNSVVVPLVAEIVRRIVNVIGSQQEEKA